MRLVISTLDVIKGRKDIIVCEQTYLGAHYGKRSEDARQLI